MTFRRRIALLAGASFVAAVLVCSVVGFVVVRREMLARIDEDLSRRVAGAAIDVRGFAGGEGPTRSRPPGGPDDRVRPPRALPTDVFLQTITTGGATASPPTQTVQLPVDSSDTSIAGQPPGTSALRDVVTDDGTRMRMITSSLGGGVAIQVTRPLTEIDETLSQFARALVLVSLAGALAAAGVGSWVARRSARPVEELTNAAAHVAETLTFDIDVAEGSDDEIGRLTTSIREMLAALRDAREQQHRLVVDASHELRTPLTSLRTNVGLLDHPDLDPGTRAEIVTDLRTELNELTLLANELVELATDTARSEATTTVDMQDVARRAAERAQRRTDQDIVVQGQAWTIQGRDAMIERAVQNLVDNACKWNPPGQSIELHVEPGMLRVRDHGPGVPADERDRIFERFYRTQAARTTPGSGLGLAIVRQIVDAHDGSVTVEDAPGGGASFILRLPPGEPS